MTKAVLLHGESEHYIDHLAPLAILQNIPLLYTVKNFSKIFSTFYPALEHYYLSPQDFDESIAHFDTLITCEPCDLNRHYLTFAESLRRKKINLIWTPHGNSDKGKHSYFMEALKREEEVFVYGDKMVDFFKEKNVWQHFKKVKHLGNYRLRYFKEHQKPFQKRGILYAPSWHHEKGTKALLAELSMIKELSCYHWMVKLHPNTLKSPLMLSSLLNLENYSHITVVSDVPTIYPLLASANLYVGDISSIGYDFLSFDRPLLFLYHEDKEHISLGELPLQKAGLTLSPKSCSELKSAIDTLLKNPNLHTEARQALYQYTFETAG